MVRSQFIRIVTALTGSLVLTACEHPRALPSGPSPQASAETADIAALQRALDVLAVDPANAGAARHAIAELLEAKGVVQKFDAEFWARLEANARSRPALPVPPR